MLDDSSRSEGSPRVRLVRQARGTLVLCALLGVVACDDGDGVIHYVDASKHPFVTGTTILVPGEQAIVYGRNIHRLTELLVDDKPVSFQILSQDSARFTVPQLRPCETDGRVVVVLANNFTSTRGTIHVPNTVSIEVGESLMFSADDLECVQLSNAREDYVLSIVSLSGDRTIDDVLRFVTPGSPAASATSGGLAAHWADDAHVSRPDPSQGKRRDDFVFTPFDDYANAEVGDTLKFVSWGWTAENATTRDALPTYEAVVLALTAGQLIVADLRQPNVDSIPREILQEAAELVDEFGLRAVRATINPNLVLPDGAGGRMVTIVQPLPWDGAATPFDLWEHIGSSNMFVTWLNTRVVRPGRSGRVAAIMIHEMAHQVDFLTERDGWSRSVGWISESFAVFAVDVAARMSHGSLSPHAYSLAGSLFSSIQRQVHDYYPPLLFGTGPHNHGHGPAAHERGARIVRFAAEQLGLAGFENTETLFQRMQRRAPRSPHEYTDARYEAWGIGALAHVAGLSVEDLLERSAIADLTDDLLPDSIVATYDLPQVASWDRTPLEPVSEYPPVGHQRKVRRDQGLNEVVQLPAGTYIYWYLPGNGFGLSFTATDIALQPHHRVRLIRLR